MKENKTEKAVTTQVTGALSGGIRVSTGGSNPPESDRREWAARGLARLIARADQAGDVSAERAQDHLTEAEMHLQEWKDGEREMLDTPSRSQPINDAVSAAAAELAKALPKSFPSMNAARVFASRLAFPEACAESAKLQRTFDLADRRRAENRKLFWIAVEQAAQLVSPTGKGTDKALDAAIEAGRYA